MQSAFLYLHNLHYEKFADGSVKCIEDEIPFELPEGWGWARLKHICMMAAGKAKSSDQIKTEPFDGCYPCFGGNGIRGYVDEYNQEGTFSIVGRQGALCGNINIASGKFYATEHAVVTTLFNGIDFNWSNYTLEALKLNEYATGAAQPGLSVANVLNVFVPVPPTQEQIYIGHQISKSIKIIENITDEKEDLQTLISAAKSKILDLAIRGQLVPQNPDDEPASVLLERIRAKKVELIKQGKIKPNKKESIIFKGDDNSYYETIGKNSICIDEKLPFELPEGWEWIRLRNLTQFIRNGASIKQYGEASGIPITRIETISTGEIDRNRFGYADIQELGKYENYVMADYDILMSHINSPKHLGKCALYRHLDNEVIIHGMNLLSIRPVLADVSEYLCIVFRSNYFKDFVWQNMKQAVNQASITTTSISDFLFPVPPYEELKQINKNVSLISNSTNKILEELL